MGLSKNLKRLARRGGNLILPAFHFDRPLRPKPEDARAVIVSFFMKNIDAAVVSAQRKVLERFVPSDIGIAQIRTRLDHGDAINYFLRTTRYRTYFLLDIDCIPLKHGAIEQLVAQAEAGHIAGAVQRASHKNNNAHLYAAPFCVAFARATFESLGRPNFVKTKRGDVGEELTYVAAERGVPIDFLWPSQVEVPLYPLVDGLMFGYGTTYQGLFWHAGESRERSQQKRFIAYCNDVLAATDDPT